jgi:glycosyltransferase involved in cell wall biosynthesis
MMDWHKNDKCLRFSGGPGSVTVLTSTYNRAGLLQRVYVSICKQFGVNFQWVIVDDGSSDDTKDLLLTFANEELIPICICVKNNTGKADSLNAVMGHISSEFVVNLDSDDELIEGSLSKMLHEWEQIPESDREHFFGVCGLCVDGLSGEVIGDTYPCSPFDSDIMYTSWTLAVKGDKIALNRVDILQNYPFPRLDKKFTPESMVWMEICKSYRIRYVNESYSSVFYQQGGLSSSVSRNASASYYAWVLNNFSNRIFFSKNDLFNVVKNSIQFIRYGGSLAPSKAGTFQLVGPLPNLLGILFYLPGKLLALSDMFHHRVVGD